ncbi:MAG: AraC family transcriptional regulator [Verrucomicrobia bacterium]|nr:AraC family transcriptional regulator [Verrucomicrobiota bacterium]MBU4291007.1 AraC family transcriptional regulator [Verrucomicrobiota bacterium]MBU4428638.1 AraC family transcriptional regulator [Verrucomicrobiota bacterium]MCG2680878.1 AraC family transcriptional regulator [Kiritimatiellia bacterium]
MKSDYETFPDDLRLRYHFCRRFHYIAPAFPPLFSYPYTVIAGLMNGKVEIGFADRGTPPLLLRAGEVCILPANCRRHTKSLSPGGVDFTAAGFLFEVKGGMDFMSFFDPPLRLDKITDRILHKLLEELLGLEIDSPQRTDLQKNVSRQRIGYAILENLLAVSAPKPGMISIRRLLPVIEHLNDNFTARPDLVKLCKLSGFSRTHFFRIFKSQSGTTPIEYVKRRRLREALLLLQESDLNISEIGDKVGWSDPFYFSKTFKSEIGLAPSVYRVQYKNTSLNL